MKNKRNGVALITVLVILAVLAIVLAVISAQIFAQHNLLRTRERQLQAQWLARAGVEWAAARLLDDPREFQAELTDLAPGGVVKVDVKKTGAGVFTVSADAAVALPDEKPVLRSASAQFRRTESKGEIRLQSER